MSGFSIDVEKVRLEDCELYPETMVNKEKVYLLVFDWKVPNYRELRKKVLYHYPVASADFNWTLKLAKLKGLLFVNLDTTVFNKLVKFSICDTDGTYSNMEKECTEISDGLYVTQFCDRVIMDSKSKYLSDGVLAIRCTYATKSRETSTKFVKYGQLRFPSDVQEFSNDLVKLYKTGNYSDFTIKSSDQVFNVHRLVLRTRSNFFYKMFRQDTQIRNSFTTEDPPTIMKHVLMFIYSGELERGLDLKSMLKVYHLAYKLEIPSLMERCVTFFQTCEGEDDSHDIFRFAKQYRMKELKDIGIGLLSNLGWLAFQEM